MIERIQLRNYQCHDRLQVDLDPKVVAIIGDSDTGKSALLRAVRWVAFNRPRTDRMIRDGESRASVRMRVDGHDVRRRRSSTENSYVLDGKVYRSFGADVPEPVAKLLNLDDVNFQSQHDPPYWFSLTVGEVAKRLNRIVDLEVIDEASGRIAGMLRKARTEVEVVDGRLADAREEEGRLAYVPKLAEALEGLEAEQAETAARRAGVAALGLSVDRAVEYEGLRERASGAASAGRGVLSLGAAAVEAAKKVDTLRGLVALARWLKAEAGRPVPDMCGLDCLQDRAVKRAAEASDLSGMVALAVRRERERDEAYNRAEEASAVLDEETGGVCPICGGLL